MRLSPPSHNLRLLALFDGGGTSSFPDAFLELLRRPPTVVTRVSEYIPEVLGLIEKIIKNGYAYESDGSVYFDTTAFKSKAHHQYGRMEPASVADTQR